MVRIFVERLTMAKEVSIEENMPHIVSEVMCAKCLYRWIAVRPVATKLTSIECPNCGLKGYVFETGEILNNED